MHINKRKEDFSKAYLRAVASTCGWVVSEWSGDQFKVDTSLSKQVVHPDGTNQVVTIDFQLKCTESPTTDNGDQVSFSLRKEDFEILSKRYGYTPLLFVMMVVPKIHLGWLSLFKDEKKEAHQSTKIKFCGYGALISDGTGNFMSEKQTIRFKKNRDEFDVDALLDIEAKISSREYRIAALKSEFERIGEPNAN